MTPRPHRNVSAARHALIPTSSTSDIAFLLLVFFMLTSTFATRFGLDFAPEDPGPPPTVVKQAAILVEILPDASLLVDHRPATPDTLLARLAPTLRGTPSKPVIVHPSPVSPYGTMVDVLDRLRQGQEQLSLPRPITIALPTRREADTYWDD